MSYLKQTIASLVVLGAFAGGALAADGRDVRENTIVLTNPNGRMVEMQMTDKAMQEMMLKDAMPMTAGVMMMMHGGKMYMVSDRKMPNGKMLSEMVMGN